MWKPLLHIFGKHLAQRAVANRGGQTRLSVRLGLALLRDSRVPFRYKLFALALGAALVAAMIALELPLESVLAVLLPGLGLFVDATVDGMEGVLGSLLFGILLLPFLAPQSLVRQIQAERAGTASGLVMDVPAQATYQNTPGALSSVPSVPVSDASPATNTSAQILSGR